MKARVKVLVSGRVQGVFFRQNTKEKARELGLKGWVKNLPDGRVEALFEGEKSLIEEILNWFKKGGVPLARIDNLEVSWQEISSDILEDFRIIY
jgi:acylphosphatase